MAQSIADHIRRRIVTGDLPAGRRLPSVARMARLFGVSVPTMHAAVHILGSLGLVRVSQGVGTFVARPRQGAALLSHAWLRMTTEELALMRFSIDSQVPVVVARLVRTGPINRLPRTLSDISFWAFERSMSRTGFPEDFLRTDLRFHAEIARSVRRAEITGELSRSIGERLLPHLAAVADVQAGDEALHDMHHALAASILDGEPVATARLARSIARREMDSLREALG